MIDFKKGDLVEIKSWEEMREEFGVDLHGNIACEFDTFIIEMCVLCGKQGIITDIYGHEVMIDDVKLDDYTITTSMIKHVKNNKKEKKEMNEILKIYKERKLNKIDRNEKKSIEKIKRSNEQYAELVALKDKYETNKHVINFDGFDFTDEECRGIAKIARETEAKKQRLCDFINEVSVQLNACETYAQKQNILIIYAIIDEEGKINA